MNYAIIAAGEGSRLKKEGFASVKPLVRVGHEYLIERLIRIFRANQAESIAVVINEESSELKQWLPEHAPDVRLVVRSTPSSLHSFWEIIQNVSMKEVCLTTVDTIFDERCFASYISEFVAHPEYDALMGSTQFIDDEKPLWIVADQEGWINSFADNCSDGGRPVTAERRISAGIYCLRQKAIAIADKSVKAGVSRMRNYQRALLEEGLRVKDFDMGKVIDIDHVDDIAKAEEILKFWASEMPVAFRAEPCALSNSPLLISRSPRFSPGSVEKDRAILEVLQKRMGGEIISEDELSEATPQRSLVVSMARSEKALDILESWNGSRIMNTPESIRNGFRCRQVGLLQKATVSMPRTMEMKPFLKGARKSLAESSLAASQIFTTSSIGEQGRFVSTWIKRGDFQTELPIDVAKVSSPDEMCKVLENYASRGIESAILMEDVEGNCVKFYGVRGTDFFRYTYPEKDKFGNLIPNQTPRHPFDEQSLRTEVSKAACALGLDIYGGDAIVAPDGHLYIIDMNDFPSFSAFRSEAADAMQLIISKEYKP